MQRPALRSLDQIDGLYAGGEFVVERDIAAQRTLFIHIECVIHRSARRGGAGLKRAVVDKEEDVGRNAGNREAEGLEVELAACARILSGIQGRNVSGQLVRHRLRIVVRRKVQDQRVAAIHEHAIDVAVSLFA